MQGRCHSRTFSLKRFEAPPSPILFLRKLIGFLIPCCSKTKKLNENYDDLTATPRGVPMSSDKVGEIYNGGDSKTKRDVLDGLLHFAYFNIITASPF
mmetsp:Transcript_5682/g.12365  ORF Transcript_5682/g.12365 Transcript_5682/m.12365 type:complete len:97 (+) Transcript_5682:1095-1385(+)